MYAKCRTRVRNSESATQVRAGGVRANWKMWRRRSIMTWPVVIWSSLLSICNDEFRQHALALARREKFWPELRNRRDRVGRRDGTNIAGRRRVDQDATQQQLSESLARCCRDMVEVFTRAHIRAERHHRLAHEMGKVVRVLGI